MQQLVKAVELEMNPPEEGERIFHRYQLSTMDQNDCLIREMEILVPADDVYYNEKIAALEILDKFKERIVKEPEAESRKGATNPMYVNVGTDAGILSAEYLDK